MGNLARLNHGHQHHQTTDMTPTCGILHIYILWQVSIRQPDVRDGVPVRGELWGVCGADPTAAAVPGTQGPHTVFHQVEECPPPPPLQCHHHHHQGDKHEPGQLRHGGGQGGPGKVGS